MMKTLPAMWAPTVQAPPSESPPITARDGPRPKPPVVHSPALFRRDRPPTIVVRGRTDRILPTEGAIPCEHDLPDAEYHLLDTGHLVPQNRPNAAGPLRQAFLDRKVARP